MNRRTTGLLAAAATTAIAHRVFSQRPPMPVLVGTEPTGDWVPVAYQLLVFPAFGAVVGGWLHDAARGGAERATLRLVVASSLVAASRLAGLHGLSGHVVFAAAAVGVRRPPQLEGLLAAAGLVGCIPYKLEWGDGSGLLRSVVVGAALAAWCVSPEPSGATHRRHRSPRGVRPPI